MQDKTATPPATEAKTLDEWLSEPAAMGERNRAALDRAKASGATTWLREEFRRGDDGVIRTATKRVPVAPRDDAGNWKQQFVADDGSVYYDAAAIREFDRWARRPSMAPRRGRAPRAATNGRSRGSKRSSARRSSERSGDSGSSDSEPPPAARLCECAARTSATSAPTPSIALTSTASTPAARATRPTRTA